MTLQQGVSRPGGTVVFLLPLLLQSLLWEPWCAPQDVLDHVRGVGEGEGGEGGGAGVGDARVRAQRVRGVGVVGVGKGCCQTTLGVVGSE